MQVCVCVCVIINRDEITVLCERGEKALTKSGLCCPSLLTGCPWAEVSLSGRLNVKLSAQQRYQFQSEVAINMSA